MKNGEFVILVCANQIRLKKTSARELANTLSVSHLVFLGRGDPSPTETKKARNFFLAD